MINQLPRRKGNPFLEGIVSASHVSSAMDSNLKARSLQRWKMIGELDGLEATHRELTKTQVLVMSQKEIVDMLNPKHESKNIRTSKSIKLTIKKSF